MIHNLAGISTNHCSDNEAGVQACCMTSSKDVLAKMVLFLVLHSTDSLLSAC